MSIKIVGGDFGNSEATVSFASGRGKKNLTIPSEIGSGSLDDLARLRGGARIDKVLEDGEYVLEYRSRTYFVGDLATKQSPDANTGRGDVTRYWRGHTLRLLLTLMGAASREINQQIFLVTGLPVETWSKETAAQVRAGLVGRHEYRLNGEDRSLTVLGVLVVMEGAGALSLFEPTGADQAVIDIGGRTTDVYVGDARLRPIMARCGNIGIGVGKIGDLLSQSFEREYGRPLKANETRNLLRSWAGTEPRQPIFANGKRVDQTVDIDSAVQAVSQQILSFVSMKLRSSERGGVGTDLSRIALIGGGAYFFRDQVEGLVSTVEVPKSPATANADGYRATGEAIDVETWKRFAA